MALQASLSQIILFITSFIFGLVIFVFAWSKPDQQQSPIDYLTGLFLSVMSMVILTGWLAVVLALFGLFSLGALAVSLLLASGGVYWWQRPFSGVKFKKITLSEWLLIGLLLVSVIVYFRPHEYILGASDAGTYMNIGATIASKGAFVEYDSWQSFLYEHADITFREQKPPEQTKYRQFVGWLTDNENPERIIPQFLPFHPTLIAVGVSLAGIYGGLFVTPLWGILSLVAVYLLSRQLFGAKVGLLSAVFLALTPTFIFFARYPTTEPLTLLLVFTALFSSYRLWDEPKSGVLWGMLGGAALGAATLTRLDLPIVVALAMGFLILAWLSGRWSRGFAALALTAVFFFVQTLLSGIFVNWPYYWNVYEAVFRVLGSSWLVWVVVGITAVFFLAIIWFISRQGWDAFTQGPVGQFFASRTLRYILIAFVVLLSAYAYFLRPILEPVTYYQPEFSPPIPVMDGQNWVRIGWYLTPLGLLLATVGLALIIYRGNLLRLSLFLSVGVLTTVQYVYRIFNTPYHIYAMRRYVPIVIPTLMIFAAVAVMAVFTARPNWKSKIAGGVLALMLMLGLGYQARYVFPVRDYWSSIAQVTELADVLEPDAIILIEDPRDSAFSDTLGVPLTHLFGYDIVPIRDTEGDLDALVLDLMTRAEIEERPLQLIAVNPIDPELRQYVHLEPVTMVPISLKMLMNTFDDYPSIMQNVYYGVEVYDVQPLDTVETNDLFIDVGSLDAAYLEDGFYYKEPIPGDVTMRWVSGEASMDIPVMSETDIVIDIRALLFDPDLNPESLVVVYLDGQKIGEFVPENTWETYSFEATAQPEHGMSSLEFESTTFTPADLGLNSDMRDLGFVLDWVQVNEGD